ncbi:MAG TPA: hypothetical protein VFZ80_03235, partial [Acidimicrobiia bacterium]
MISDHPASPPPVSRPWIAAAGFVWLVMSAIGSPHHPPLEHGVFNGPLVLLTDSYQGHYGPWAIGAVSTGRVLVDFEENPPLSRGDTAIVFGEIGGGPGVAAGRGFGGVLRVQDIAEVTRSRFVPHRAGALLRRRVDDAL